MIGIAFSLILFAFCINAGIYFIGNALDVQTLKDMTPEIMDPDLFNSPSGTAGEILNETSTSGFGGSNLIGDLAGSLNMAFALLSNGYLVAIMQSVGGDGFSQDFVLPIQSILLIINVVMAIQFVRGLVFS